MFRILILFFPPQNELLWKLAWEWFPDGEIIRLNFFLSKENGPEVYKSKRFQISVQEGQTANLMKMEMLIIQLGGNCTFVPF